MSGITEVVIRYAGRDEVALVGLWLVDGDGRLVGVHLHHPYELVGPDGPFPHCAGGGYVSWVPGDGRSAWHQLVAGGPDDVDALTLAPSLWHRARDQSDASMPLHANGSRCSPHRECHGHVRAGRWVVA